ncbi:MAG: lysylphosphatidylglycerol synthetase family protein [Shinella sp.]|nr:MAG: lysylphosphatidylglycerol synthetase family protein [Shinella sp.]
MSPKQDTQVSCEMRGGKDLPGGDLDEACKGATAGEKLLAEEIERQKSGITHASLWIWLPGVLFLAVLLLLALHFEELKHFAELATAADVRWLLLGAAVQALTYVCAGGVWWLALCHAGYPMRFIGFAPLGLGKLFVDQALPTGGVSGTILVTAGLKNRGIPLRIAFYAMLTGLFTYYSAYLASAVVCFFVIYMDHRMGSVLASTFAVFAVVALFIPLSVLLMKAFGPRFIPGWIARQRIVRILLLEIAEAPLAQLLNRRLFLGAFSFQIAIVVLDATTLWIAFKAIGRDVDVLVAFAGMVAGSIGATIGPAPLGLGTYEGSAVAILAILGVPVAPSITAVILFRGLSFWLPMVPGIWFARRELALHKNGSP